MKLPEAVSITVKGAGRPLGEMWVVLEFLMSRKNPYQLAFGPSDSNGQIRVTSDQIRTDALKVNQLFLMDYAPLEAFWAGTLRVTPMNRAALQRALSASRMFHHFEHPPGYQDMLLAADAILSKLAAAMLEATVRCEPSGGFIVETMPVEVG